MSAKKQAVVPTRLVELRAENFRRLQAVSITLPGDKRLVQVSGPNNAGKSSVLDAIFAGLGGAAATPTEPVHRGAKKAQLTLKLQGGLNAIVRREIRESGHMVTITAGDGEPMKSPQSVLDALWDPTTADPLALDRLTETAKGRKEYRDILLRIAGIDPAEIEKRRKKIYDKRTLVNHERDGIAKILKDMLVDEKLPVEPVSLEKITAEIVAAERHNTEVKNLRVELEKAAWERTRAEAAAKAAENRVAELRSQYKMGDDALKVERAGLTKEDVPLAPLLAEIKRLQAELAAAQQRYNDAVALNEVNAEMRRGIAEKESAQAVLAEQGKAAKEKAALAAESLKSAVSKFAELDLRLVDVDEADVEGLRKKLDDAEKTNENIRAAAAKRTRREEYKERCRLSDALTEQLAEIDRETQEKLKAAKFSVEGLGVDDDGPTLSGNPLASEGTANRYRVAVGIGLAALRENVKAIDGGVRTSVNLMLIRDGSLLDSKTKAALIQVLDEYDAYALSEVVDESGKVGIVIEDGSVVRVNE